MRYKCGWWLINFKQPQLGRVNVFSAAGFSNCRDYFIPMTWSRKYHTSYLQHDSFENAVTMDTWMVLVCILWQIEEAINSLRTHQFRWHWLLTVIIVHNNVANVPCASFSLVYLSGLFCPVLVRWSHRMIRDQQHCWSTTTLHHQYIHLTLLLLLSTSIPHFPRFSPKTCKICSA